MVTLMIKMIYYDFLSKQAAEIYVKLEHLVSEIWGTAHCGLWLILSRIYFGGVSAPDFWYWAFYHCLIASMMASKYYSISSLLV